MALHLVSIAALGVFPIFLDYQRADVMRMQPQEEEKRSAQHQEPQAPPISVLRNLRTNFEKLESNMCDDEIFRTLGLAKYQKHLQANSKFMMDGAGGNWRYYIDEQNDYSLVLWSFWGANVECRLKLPGEKHWRRKLVDAKPINPSYLELNPQSIK